MELVITKPTEDMFIKSVEFNFDELKSELTNRLLKYEGLTYSDSEIKDAKGDRATLNKFKTAIEDKRKEMKQKFLEPYESFEKRIKELVALVEKPIVEIDKQVKSFEQRVKDEKKSNIIELYNANIGDLGILLTIAAIWDERWLNAGIKLKEVEDTIKSKIEKVKTDLNVIDTLNTEFALQVKDHYLRTFDLSGALAEKARLEDQKAKLAAYKPAEVKPEPVQPIAPKVEAVSDTPKTPEIIQIDFRVFATAIYLEGLKKYMVTNNIKFERIK